MDGSTVLELVHVNKTFSSGTVAIKDVSLELKEGEFVTIVGPSGCGKTTLLRCVAGLEAPTGGHVRFRGAEVVSPPEGLGLVFQEYGRSLLPWMSVIDNVILPLRAKRITKGIRRAQAADALEAVGLLEFANAWTWELSGGMQQRVALARALAYGAGVLLMDEPFASVDAQTRARLEDLLINVRRQFGLAIVLVTHDVDEAVYLGDRVLVISKRPAEVRCSLDIDLPSARNQVTTKEMSRFAQLRTLVAREIDVGVVSGIGREFALKSE